MVPYLDKMSVGETIDQRLVTLRMFRWWVVLSYQRQDSFDDLAVKL